MGGKRSGMSRTTVYGLSPRLLCTLTTLHVHNTSAETKGRD